MNNNMKIFKQDQSIINTNMIGMNQKVLDQALARLIINVYIMPKWQKDKSQQLRQLYGKLNEEFHDRGLKLDYDKNIINKLSYESILKQSKDFIIQSLTQIYRDIPFFKYCLRVSQFLLTIQPNEQLINSICNTLFHQIALTKQYIRVKNEHKQAIRQMIQEMLGKKVIFIKDNDKSGANVGFVIQINNNSKYYVKTFSKEFKQVCPYTNSQKINCRELFAYKVLEYLGFGPKTYFLIRNYVSEPSKPSYNYIMTQDVTHVGDQEHEYKKQFLRDHDSEHEKQYYQSFKHQNFKIQLLALVCLNDILELIDSFGNPKNYGIIKTTFKDQTIKYEPILIDHWPSVSTKLKSQSYSPGKILKESFHECMKNSNLKKVMLGGNISSQKLKLRQKIKLIIAKGKKQMGFKQSILKTQQQIQKLIVNTGSFLNQIADTGKIITANILLKRHTERMINNYQLFLQNYNQ